MINFSPLAFDDIALEQYVRLFSICFPNTTKYSLKYLKWLYCENPTGLAVGYNAWDGNQLAAHYVCVPSDAMINGRNVKVLLSLNTATHPKYQGQGLFTKLAEMTYAMGSENNFAGIYGVANSNSTPGFIKKLGFKLVEPLMARIGVGSLSIDYELLTKTSQFERVWSPASFLWRCSNPANTVYFNQQSGVMQFYAPAFGRLISAYAELPSCELMKHEPRSLGYLSSVRLFLGLIPESCCRFRKYADIPHRLRPSPLNFIYRPLCNNEGLDRGQAHLSFLDFDAY